MARDYYEEARSLANEIRVSAAALADWADKIEDVIANGYTASQILMGLRFQIQAMLADEQSIALSSPLSERAVELSNAIDEALR